VFEKKGRRGGDKRDGNVGAIKYKPVKIIQDRPMGYFMHMSITTPVVSALKKYYIQGFLEARSSG
jgi:hypothetical protein